MEPGHTKPPASKEIEIAAEKMEHTNPPTSKEIEIPKSPSRNWSMAAAAWGDGPGAWC